MFTIGKFHPLEAEPDPDLLVQIGWKAEQYDFEFLEAAVVYDGRTTNSWVEAAFSRQLGGAFVLWRSGVSALDAARSAAYGWIESNEVSSIAEGIETKAKTYGPPLDGYHFDSLAFYRMYPGQSGIRERIQPTADRAIK
jgi:hypothetical protein